MKLWVQFVEDTNGPADNDTIGPSASFEPPMSQTEIGPFTDDGNHRYAGRVVGEIVDVSMSGGGFWITWMVPDNWYPER